MKFIIDYYASTNISEHRLKEIPVISLRNKKNVEFLPRFQLIFKNEKVNEVIQKYYSFKSMNQKEAEFILNTYLNPIIGMNINELTNYLEAVNLIISDLDANQLFPKELAL